MTQELFGPVWTPVLMIVSALTAGFSGVILWRSLVLTAPIRVRPKAQDRMPEPVTPTVIRSSQQYN